MDTQYVLTLTVNDVSDGDIENLAQSIWDEHAEELDAGLGDFGLSISRGGLPFDWQPKT